MKIVIYICFYLIIFQILLILSAIITKLIKQYKISRFLFSALYLIYPFKIVEKQIYFCCNQLYSECKNDTHCNCWSCPEYSKKRLNKFINK